MAPDKESAAKDPQRAMRKRTLSIAEDVPWERTPVGAVEEWPPLLKSFVTFSSSLPHAAALYWGDNLTLILNDPWRIMHGDALQQGQPQIELLDEAAVKSLQQVMTTQEATETAAKAYLNHAPRDLQLLLSPVIDFETGECHGVLAQQVQFQSRSTVGGRSTFSVDSPLLHSLSKPKEGLAEAVMENVDTSELPTQNEEGDGASDDLHLDEHPFFRRIAAMLPTGLAILNHKAEAIFVNRQFYELTTNMENERRFKSWPHTIHPDDYPRVMDSYQDAVGSRKPLRIEFKCNGKEEVWRLLLLSPLADTFLRRQEAENRGGFMCALIDTSSNKQAEFSKAREADEARRRREQQERVIDMVSHEIRNPLSAVLHCAEGIMDVLNNDSLVSKATRDDIMELADTIQLCVVHQKNIVDDVLSFSKLDSSMLFLTPRAVQPNNQLRETLKMFHPEFRKQRIEFSYSTDSTYRDCNVDWVKADLVRISQVLVNLITNAIKFTAKQDHKREIAVSVGASIDQPKSYPPGRVAFDEDLGFRMDDTNAAEWGNGPVVYVAVAVQDTGIGIGGEAQQNIFQRFHQATRETEEVYGGSGLGLNISRNLCQLHGGEIGVSSREGQGSTFSFYFKARRTVDPDTENDQEDGGREAEDPPSVKIEAPMDSSAKDDDAKKSPEAREKMHTQRAPNSFMRDKALMKRPELPSRSKSHSAESVRSHVEERPSASRSASVQSEKGPKASPETEITNENAMRSSVKPKILLVDDNLINQRIVRRHLESKGFYVLTAKNGMEAVEAVRVAGEAANKTDAPHVGFDVVLMDQEMPTMDGSQATQAIRQWETRNSSQDGAVKHVPILGVSGSVREEQMKLMRSSGMDDLIAKPYQFVDMVNKINDLIGNGASSKGSRPSAARRGTSS